MNSIFVGNTEHRLLYVLMTVGLTKKTSNSGGINLLVRSKELFSGDEPTEIYNSDLSLIGRN